MLAFCQVNVLNEYDDDDDDYPISAPFCVISYDDLLTHGCIGDRLWWYPAAHLLHVSPATPSLHAHWPLDWSHVRPTEPSG